jgi:hypothetical protein
VLEPDSDESSSQEAKSSCSSESDFPRSTKHYYERGGGGSKRLYKLALPDASKRKTPDSASKYAKNAKHRYKKRQKKLPLWVVDFKPFRAYLELLQAIFGKENI